MAKTNLSNIASNNQPRLVMTATAALPANVMAMASCYAVEAATGAVAAFHYCSTSRAGGMSHLLQIACYHRNKRILTSVAGAEWWV